MSKSQSERTKADEQNTQAGLTDFSYEEHAKPSPPEDEVSVDVSTTEDFNTVSMGDELWVDGDRYSVVTMEPGLVSLPTVVLIDEQQNTREIIGGPIETGGIGGVAWRKKVKETENVTRKTLEAEFEDVYILNQNDDLETLHEMIPDVDHRDCPGCNERDAKQGNVIHSELQNESFVEIRKCTNTDCRTVFRVVKEVNYDSEATILTRDDNNQVFNLEHISGFFDAEEQDDFKFPLNTHDGKDDGFRNAATIAEFFNKKLVGEGINDLLNCKEQFSVSELLELVEFTRTETGITETKEVEITDWGEVISEMFEYEDTSCLEDTLTGVSDDTFAKTLLVLESVKSPEGDYEWNRMSDSAVASFESVSQAIDDYLIGEDVDGVTETVAETIVETFERDVSGKEFLTSTAFYELIVETAETSVFGRTRVYDRAGENTRITWRDAVNRFDKMMKLSYDEIKEGNEMKEFRIGYHWGMDEYDVTQFIGDV